MTDIANFTTERAKDMSKNETVINKPVNGAVSQRCKFLLPNNECIAGYEGTDRDGRVECNGIDKDRSCFSEFTAKRKEYNEQSVFGYSPRKTCKSCKHSRPDNHYIGNSYFHCSHMKEIGIEDDLVISYYVCNNWSKK